MATQFSHLRRQGRFRWEGYIKLLMLRTSFVLRPDRSCNQRSGRQGGFINNIRTFWAVMSPDYSLCGTPVTRSVR